MTNLAFDRVGDVCHVDVPSGKDFGERAVVQEAYVEIVSTVFDDRFDCQKLVGLVHMGRHTRTEVDPVTRVRLERRVNPKERFLGLR